MADINTTQLRDALAWATNDKEKGAEPSTNPLVWFWEAIEGDFNENRSTAQILTDAGISMIPLVDQVCDIRDLIANCRKISKDHTDVWAWVSLALTLIGLFPSLGSLVKGVLKIFFAYVRRAGPDQVAKAVDAAMSTLIAFLRRKDVQQRLKALKSYKVFETLAKEIKAFRARINVGALLAAFDRGIKVIEELADRVAFVPTIGAMAKDTLMEVKRIRDIADSHLKRAIRPLQDAIDTIVLRLEKQALEERHGIVDVANIHYFGAMPAGDAVRLMAKYKPKWLSKTGEKFYTEANLLDGRRMVDSLSSKVDFNGKPIDPKEVYPWLSDQSIKSFHKLEPATIHGPARLFRILAPNSRAMSDCWVSQEVFERIQSSPNPKEAWRRFLAVWPDWNVNGQFVVYDIKAGESLKVWRGPASSQTKKNLPGHHLEGGWEQIVFNVERGHAHHDTMLYYPIHSGKSPRLGKPLTQDEVNLATAKMSQAQKDAFFAKHFSARKNINHPNISGPYETGWGYDEFGGAGLPGRIGIPAFPGQVTVSKP